MTDTNNHAQVIHRTASTTGKSRLCFPDDMDSSNSDDRANMGEKFNSDYNGET